ncbi:MAG: RagB/SusD family nutrient uptake outer membrane protein, partial [Ginsengibacter sp.]
MRPYSSVSSDIAISNVSDMQAAVNGAYSALKSVNLYKRTIPLFGDLVADNVYISAINSNRYLDFFQLNYTITNTNAQGIWQSAYVVILRANNVINSSLQGNADIDQLRGEALAIRALMYFELEKFFAKPYTVDPNGLGVPLVLQYDPKLKPSRNTTAEVYTQIEADLTQAISLMTKNKSSGVFTKYAAKALLSRMYLFKGDWTNALATAKDVIDNSGYSLLLLNAVIPFWQNNSARTDKKEVLFEVVFDGTDDPESSLPTLFDQTGYGDALAVDDFYNKFSNTDVRKSFFVVGSPTRGANAKVINKFPNANAADRDDMKVIRISEVYLIAAEAAYHLNNEPLALTYVNAVATQRDPNFTGYTSTGSALLNDVLLEKRKELAFE